MRNTKGITLIALIITIIVMLILVGVVVQVVIQSDLLGTAKTAGDEYKTAYEEESNMSGVVVNGKKYDSIEDYLAGKESPVDWEKVLADATANPNKYRHPDQQSTNKDIGIGTDGKPVNLDLWKYRTEDENSKEIILNSATGSGPLNYGYSNSNIIDGKIQGTVPQYIKFDGKSEFYPVTDMNNTFVCSKLIIAPEIPTTIKSMVFTFHCCTELTTISEIPSSVNNMEYTFSSCSKLQGTIKINANPTNYPDCFSYAATEGPGLVVTGESTMLDELIGTKSANSNITKGE